MSPEPYWQDEDGRVRLFLGRFEDVLPHLATERFDLAVVDAPYGETSLEWDRWPDGWPTALAAVTRSMWCFGSMRMFLDRRDEFTAAGWKLSQDLVWEKHNGSGFHADRFKRVHEHVAHWYRGDWESLRHETPTTPDATARVVRTKRRPDHMGQIDKAPYVSQDGGPRLMRSVLQVRSMHGRAIHPCEKPAGVLVPLIEYACPVGGLVLDPFAGSASTLAAARLTGRRAVGIEAHEPYAEAAALRLSQGVLDLGGAA